MRTIKSVVSPFIYLDDYGTHRDDENDKQNCLDNHLVDPRTTIYGTVFRITSSQRERGFALDQRFSSNQQDWLARTVSDRRLSGYGKSAETHHQLCILGQQSSGLFGRIVDFNLKHRIGRL